MFRKIILIMAIFLIVMGNMFMVSHFLTNQPDATEVGGQRNPRLGDGCYHIFLDVGANVGVHGRFLLEPEKYPRTKFSVDIFAKEYGKELDNRDVCVFEFEANSVHWPRLMEISEAYSKMGWRYHVIKAAVSDENGSATFYHQGGKNELNHNEWGFSGAKSFNITGGYSIEVPTIRLSEWINTHIHERLVPPFPHRSTAGENINVPGVKKPILGMKMDIEGYEYVVLPDLIHSGAICHFDFVFGEMHPNFSPITQFRNMDAKGTNNFHRVSLNNIEETKRYGSALMQVMQASRNCPVRYTYADDESYLHDGMPLPTP
jgi:hypothetical protein